jgi:hypothetical protein
LCIAVILSDLILECFRECDIIEKRAKANRTNDGEEHSGNADDLRLVGSLKEQLHASIWI